MSDEDSDGGGAPDETSGSAERPEMDDVFDELEELATMVDSTEEHEQVMETMETLRKSRRTQLIGRFRSRFGIRDGGEAVVGAFIFGIPMIVEGGTLEVGDYLASHPLLLGLTLVFGGVVVYGILRAVKFQQIEDDMLLGVVSVRLFSIPFIALVMGFGLMTAWGRVDWASPMVAASQCLVTSIAMAVGASLGDILPEG